MRALLVTGGLGYIGAHFVHAAAAAGRRLVVLDDLSGGEPQPLPARVALVRGDVGDKRTVLPLLVRHDVGAIVHFAGKIQVAESVRRPAHYFDVNLVRSLALLEAARSAGVEVFVFSSSAAVYGIPERVPVREDACRRPINAYGASKLGVEHALEAYAVAHGLRWAALRYFNAAGAHPSGALGESHQPETHLVPLAIDAALGRGPALVIHGDGHDTDDGTCVRDFVHVMDLADAHLAALERLESGRPVGALNLGTGRGHSVSEVIETTGRVLHRHVPASIGPPRPGDPATLVADAGAAQRLLEWTPARSRLETIIEDAARSRVHSPYVRSGQGA